MVCFFGVWGSEIMNIVDSGCMMFHGIKGLYLASHLRIYGEIKSRIRKDGQAFAHLIDI